jgi:hypothetical protein
MGEEVQLLSNASRPDEGCGPHHIRDVLAELLDQFPEATTPRPKAAQRRVRVSSRSGSRSQGRGETGENGDRSPDFSFTFIPLSPLFPFPLLRLRCPCPRHFPRSNSRPLASPCRRPAHKEDRDVGALSKGR